MPGRPLGRNGWGCTVVWPNGNVGAEAETNGVGFGMDRQGLSLAIEREDGCGVGPGGLAE